MSFHVSLDSLESIHNCVIGTLLEDPDCEAAPRGKPIKELIAASFTLIDPRNRLIMSPARAVNYGFAVGELCWYLRGDTDLETMRYYNKRMTQFSDDGKTINSAYGHRLFKTRFRENQFSGLGHDAWDRSQLDNVIEELRRDPDSRRAVMHINEPVDLDRATTRGSKDVPCTMSIQLLIRDRRLHMHALMRSNDVVWGLPYDVFSFTCLQEAFLYMLQEQDVPVDDLGSYNHTAGSLHLYDTHFGMADMVTKEQLPDPIPMKPFTLRGLKWLAEEAEPMVRASVIRPGIEWSSIPSSPEDDPEATTIDWMAAQLADHRHKRVLESLHERGNLNKENDVKQA